MPTAWTDKPKVTTVYTTKLPAGKVEIIGELFDIVELYRGIELTSTPGSSVWSIKTTSTNIWTDKG